MQVAFPSPVLVRSTIPELAGLRHNPFTNIDGETFSKPTLNGFWKLDLSVIAHDMLAQLALSSFVTAMSAAASECVVPVLVQWLPNGAHGRMLDQGGVGPSFTFDHTGFENEPFDGYSLLAAAAHRDSYIDVQKPELSHLWPGHFITLGDRLHQVVNVNAIGESATQVRLHVMPNIRDGYPLGETVIVDQLRLRCRLEKGDQIGHTIDPVRFGNLSFIEAF